MAPREKGPGLVVVHVVTVLMTYVKSHGGVRFLSVTQHKSHGGVRFHVSPDAHFGQCPCNTPYRWHITGCYMGIAQNGRLDLREIALWCAIYVA